MAEKIKAASLILRTPMIRMSYPHLVTPEAYKDRKTGVTGAPMFNMEMLIPNDVLDQFEVLREGDEWVKIDVKLAMAEVAKAEWPDISIREAVANKGLGWPLKDGNAKKAAREEEGKKGDAYENVKILPVKTGVKYPPQLYVVEGRKFRELMREVESDMTRAASLFVAGNYAKANLNVRAVATPQGRYVTFYVNAVMFAKEGARIGGMSPEDRFGGIEGGMADVDPTEGLEDDIPL